MILIGLDLGTQSLKVMAAREDGTVLAQSAAAYKTVNAAQDPLKEQYAEDWEAAALTALQDAAAQLRAAGCANEPAVLAVDGTSGTILPIDRTGKPLRTALMYNDPRAASVMPKLRPIVADLEEKLGYKMGASFALPKILWLKEKEPNVYAKTAAMVHQADYIVGLLTGQYQVSDYSNTLKTGYDLLDGCWPQAELDALGIDAALLPRVVRPGDVIAPITREAAQRTGLSLKTVVAAGATDGYASCVASGAVHPGQYNTTIGTTMVIKGVSDRFVRDPQGRIYSHKHPEGYWYPGGAGNVGGLCLNQWFGAENFARLNAQAAAAVPTGNLIYPLTTKGERFPFLDAEATGFQLLQNEDEAARYAGTMEGVAYVERLCYDTMQQLGCPAGGQIHIAGGAVKSPEWSQIRANVLGRTLCQPQIVEAAFGSAILAGTQSLGRTLTGAADAMVRYVRRFTPDAALHAEYDALYEKFLRVCTERGYIA